MLIIFHWEPKSEIVLNSSGAGGLEARRLSSGQSRIPLYPKVSPIHIPKFRRGFGQGGGLGWFRVWAVLASDSTHPPNIPHLDPLPPAKSETPHTRSSSYSSTCQSSFGRQLTSSAWESIITSSWVDAQWGNQSHEEGTDYKEAGTAKYDIWPDKYAVISRWKSRVWHITRWCIKPSPKISYSSRSR